MRRASNPKNVLVIDDDMAFGQLTRLRLEKAGHRATFHRGPFGALHAIRESRADLVVLDFGMPGLDGAQIVKLVRSTPGLERTKVLIFSGLDPMKLEQVGRELGAPCVAKGSAWHSFMEQVDKVLASRA